MITVTIYKDRDNLISLGLKADGILRDVSGSSRMILQIGDTIPDLAIDSTIYTNAFDWTTNGANGQVDIDIGRLNGIDRGKFRSRLTIFDATYTHGLVWDEFLLVIK